MPIKGFPGEESAADELAREAAARRSQTIVNPPKSFDDIPLASGAQPMGILEDDILDAPANKSAGYIREALERLSAAGEVPKAAVEAEAQAQELATKPADLDSFKNAVGFATAGKMFTRTMEAASASNKGKADLSGTRSDLDEGVKNQAADMDNRQKMSDRLTAQAAGHRNAARQELTDMVSKVGTQNTLEKLQRDKSAVSPAVVAALRAKGVQVPEGATNEELRELAAAHSLFPKAAAPKAPGITVKEIPNSIKDGVKGTMVLTKKDGVTVSEEFFPGESRHNPNAGQGRPGAGTIVTRDDLGNLILVDKVDKTASPITGTQKVAEDSVYAGLAPKQRTKVDEVVAKEWTGNKIVGAIRERVNAVDNAKELLSQADAGNGVSGSALKTEMARLAGEKGALSEGDIARFAGDPSFYGRFERYTDVGFNGKIPPSDIKLFKQVIEGYEKTLNTQLFSLKTGVKGKLKNTIGNQVPEAQLNDLFEGTNTRAASSSTGASGMTPEQRQARIQELKAKAGGK